MNAGQELWRRSSRHELVTDVLASTTFKGKATDQTTTTDETVAA